MSGNAHRTLPGQEAGRQGTVGVGGGGWVSVGTAKKARQGGSSLLGLEGRPKESKDLSFPCLSPAVLATRTLLSLVMVSAHVASQGGVWIFMPHSVSLSALSSGYTVSVLGLLPPPSFPSAFATYL